MQELLKKRDHYKAVFHNKPLLIAWMPLVNFAVIFAALKWSKYSFYIHLLFSIAIITLTLCSTVYILVEEWLSPDWDWKLQKVHNIGGLAIVIWLGVQVITGVAARVAQALPSVKTNTCIWIRRIHYVSSYLLMIVSKFQYLMMFAMKEEWYTFGFYVLVEIAFLAIYLWIKFSYWTLSQDIIDSQLTTPSFEKTHSLLSEFYAKLKIRLFNVKQEIQQQSFALPQYAKPIPTILSEDEISIPNYVLFNDVVYDISKLKYLHPGGQSVIDLMNKRQVNRFMYGYYKPENDSKTKTHMHSKESMRLCGKPISKIQRLSPVEGFDDLNKFRISLMKPILQDSNVWVLYLQPIFQSKQAYSRLKFNGYTEESQLGQHLTLTICDKKGRKRCTKLYTSVWSMRASSLYLIQKLIPGYKISFNFITQKQATYQDCGLTQNLIKSEAIQTPIETINDTVPLLIKKYNRGQLTSRLIKDDFDGQIVLSKPMGDGMRYHEVPHSGKVIIVCAGTGILPFCDFIDLLLKQVKILEGTQHENLLKLRDPLVGKDLIRNRSFVFYLAVDSCEDLMLTTIYQLGYLCRSEKIKFEVVMKIKKNAERIKETFKKFKYQDCGFNQQIESHLAEDLSKIFICGPERMNEEMSNIFKAHQVPKEKYLFM